MKQFLKDEEKILNNQTELAEMATQDLQEVSPQMTKMMEAKINSAGIQNKPVHKRKPNPEETSNKTRSRIRITTIVTGCENGILR